MKEMTYIPVTSLNVQVALLSLHTFVERMRTSDCWKCNPSFILFIRMKMREIRMKRGVIFFKILGNLNKNKSRVTKIQYRLHEQNSK